MPNTSDFISSVTPASGIDQWVTATAYTLDQYVEEGVKLYRCVLAHTSSALFVTDAANWVEVSPAEAIVTLLDSSGGAVIATLPAATGSGAVRKYAIKDKTNSITFAVASGDYLNELLNSTYLASNHAVGTEFELVDYATDKWALNIVGAPTSLPLIRYAIRGVAANISTVNGPNILPIGSLVNSDLVSSGLLTSGELDPFGMRTANQITVPKTGLYRVDVLVVHTAANLVGTDAQTASGSSRSGIRINGVLIEWTGIDDTAGLADQTMGFIVRQFTAGDEIDVVVNATSVEVNEDYYVSFAVEELPTTETILAGMIVPTPLVFSHARATASQAVADSTNVLISLDTAVSDASGLFVSGTNRIVIATSGLYRIRGVIPWSSSGNPGIQSATILVNGVAIKSSSTRNNQPLAVTEVETTLLLVAGDHVQLRARQETGVALTTTIAATNLANVYPELEVRQLPLSTVVNPDTVPVTTLSKASINVIGSGVGSGPVMSLTSTTGLANNPSTIMPTTARLNLTAAGWTSPTSQILVDTITVGATDLTIVNTGLYRINASATIAGVNASGIQIVRNGAVIAFGSMYAQPTSGRGDPTATCVVNLTAGDVIDFRVANQNTAALTVELFSIDVVQLPGHSIVKYTPGDVIVENLHYLELNRSNVPTSGGAADFATGAVVGSGTGKWVQGASVGATANLTTGTITVAQSGTYVISTALNHYAAGGSATFAIRKNGTSILPIYVEGGDTAGSDDISWANQTIADLVAGDVIDLFCSSSGMTNRYFGAGSFISIRQMPTGLLVDPGTVPAGSLHYASIYGDMQSNVSAANGQTNVYNFSTGTVGTNIGSMINVAGNQIAIQQSGTYRLFLTAFDGTDACNPTIVKNAGVIVSTSQFAGGDSKYPGVIDVIVPLLAGDILTFKDVFGTLNTQRGVRITVQQLPSHSIVAYTPGDVIVEDLPSFRAYSAAAQTISNATVTKLNFATEAYDATLSYDASTSTFTAPTAGKYHFDWAARIVSTVGSSSGDYYTRVLTSTGQELRAGLGQMGGYTWSNGSGDLNLVAGETVIVQILTLWGSSPNVDGGQLTYFSGHKLPIGLLVDPGTVPVTNLKRAHVVQTADQTTSLTIGSPILFSGGVAEGSLPYAAGVFTLEAGKTYSLLGGVTIVTGTELIFQWRDITTNTLIGSAGNTLTTGAGRGTVASAVLTTSAPTTVRLEITTNNAVTLIGSSSGRGAWAVVEEKPTSTVVAYTPGDVTATALASGQTAAAAITTGQTTTSTSFVDITGASVTLPQAGTYEIEYCIPVNHGTVGAAVYVVLTDSSNNVVPGTATEMGEASGGGITGSNTNRARVTVTGPTTYKVRWRVNAGTGTLFNTSDTSAWLRYEQQPTHEVVTPGDVPVTPLSYLNATVNAQVPPNNNPVNVAGTLRSGTIGYTPATGALALLAGQTYNLRASIRAITNSDANGSVQYWFSTTSAGASGTALNGLTAFAIAATAGAPSMANPLLDITYTPATNETVYLVCAVTSSASRDIQTGSLTVTQMPTATVVDPGAITVNDQSATGYIDIGTTRMQWGRFTTANATTQTVNLPAAFANTGYSVTLSPNANGIALIATDVVNSTASAFTFINRNAGGGANTSAGLGFNYIAMGVKP